MEGKELKMLRIKAGMTQSDLAKLLGYTSKGEPNRSQIARFENGHAPINPRIEAALRLYLGERWDCGVAQAEG